MSATSEQRTVLIVEGDPDIRESLETICQDEGFHVFVAATGKEAMELLNTQIHGACLILLDISNPSISGFDFLKARKDTHIFVQIPVVVMSTSRKVTLPPDASAALKKPLNLDELITMLRTYCGDATKGLPTPEQGA